MHSVYLNSCIEPLRGVFNKNIENHLINVVIKILPVHPPRITISGGKRESLISD